MKRLIAFVSICALWPLASCGGGGTLESCMGPYTGTFEVTVNGTPLEGRLLSYLGSLDVTETMTNGLEFRLTVDTETTEMVQERITATVTEDGVVEGTSAGIELTGKFDFDACEASGTWQAGTFYTDGTWRLTSDSTAY